ncbi:hypothetical protein IMCC21906_02282 [Spongiibacter sp. IMCC21906]|nr:hypothetical protein IMCC21906_02282 [Spongiibacter sp. IMCC21906]
MEVEESMPVNEGAYRHTDLSAASDLRFFRELMNFVIIADQFV